MPSTIQFAERVCITGHRPDKLWIRDQYSLSNHNRLVNFASNIFSKLKPESIVTGMALGWDQACAEAAIALSIPFHAAIPCPNQPMKWPLHNIARWKMIRDQAATVYYVSDHYYPGCMQARNQYMVDQSERVLALWNGTSGGTANCIAYAKSKNREIINVWDDFEELEAR